MRRDTFWSAKPVLVSPDASPALPRAHRIRLYPIQSAGVPPWDPRLAYSRPVHGGAAADRREPAVAGRPSAFGTAVVGAATGADATSADRRGDRLPRLAMQARMEL